MDQRVGIAEAGLFGDGGPMARAEVFEFPVGVGGAHGHGEGGFLPGNLMRLRAHHGPNGEHVVEWRHPIRSAGFVKQGEIFRVAIRRGEEPEEDLGLDEIAAVTRRLSAEGQHVEHSVHARSTLIFVFLPTSDAERLAEILLRSARDPFGALPDTVETFHDEHAVFSEVGDFGVGGFQSEGGQQFQAQPLVFYRIAQIDLKITDDAEREFEDVGGRVAPSGRHQRSL